MKAFVTGGTGFLGSHLVDLLLAEGHEVTCLVRPASNLRWLKGKKVRLIQGGLFHGNAGLPAGLKNADWCFHAAGVVSTTDPQEYFNVNAGGTRHCLEACLKAAPNLKRFVLISSIAAAGPSLNGGMLDETVKPHSTTIYGESKLEAERIALGYKPRMPIAVLRPPAIYGPRDRMILPVFKMAASQKIFFYPAGPAAWRSGGYSKTARAGGPQVTMAYVEDAARACLWAAKSEKAAGEIFYVGDGDLYRWQDIGDALAAALHHKVRKIPALKSFVLPLAWAEEFRARVFHGTPRIHRGYVDQCFQSWRCSVDKITAAGFVPRFDLASGMRACVAGYRQIGWL